MPKSCKGAGAEHAECQEWGDGEEYCRLFYDVLIHIHQITKDDKGGDLVRISN